MIDGAEGFQSLLMDTRAGLADISILPRTLGLGAEALDARERRELLVASVGARLVGVFADEADMIAEWKQTTPLPHAPTAIVGVVGVRGLIRTVLDPLAILGERPAGQIPEFGFVIALGGDEQLALAVDRVERIISVLPEEVEPLGSAAGAGPVRGLVQGEGKTVIAVLNPEELFRAAMRGTERRRKRIKEETRRGGD